jgi:hypothetical protein
MRNKTILIIGGTGFVGTILSNILSTYNTVIPIGRTTKVNYEIGQEVSLELKKLISSSQLVIFASWDFNISSDKYIKIHCDSVLQFLKICKDFDTSFLFISTALSNKVSRSLYNKAKHMCEILTIKHGASCMRIGVLVSKLTKSGNIYLKLSKLPSIYGYKLMLKPDNKKFKLTHIDQLTLFFNSYSVDEVNIFQDTKQSETYSLSEILEMFSEKKYKYIYIDWKLIYYILKTFRFLGINLRINLDSLISIWGENINEEYL